MKQDFFQNNRQRLVKALDSSFFVLAGHTEMQRGNDSSFAFEQDANFWYLTGIEASNWVLVIEKDKSWLVAPDVSEMHRIFNGSLTFDDAKRISGVDTVVSFSEGRALLETLKGKYKQVATLGKDPFIGRYNYALNTAQPSMLRWLKKQFDSVEDCRLHLAKLRAIKQPEEIAVMRSAIDMTVDAFKQVKSKLGTYKHEYEIEADFSHFFRSHGAKGHAYDPIVAGGKNACTLHYMDNKDSLVGGNLLLLDIGARRDGYAADITRTYALGVPTDRQKAVHKAVESAQEEIIGLLRPGLDLVEYAKKVDEIMKEKLNSLGLLNDPDDYRKYFPHSVSHGLGVDVHDALGRPTEFQAGMVLTVEPGIYIPEEGIGVRIEDDILITKTSHENLSSGLPTSL